MIISSQYHQYSYAMTDKHSSDIEIHSDLLDSLLAHIAIIDADGTILETNQAWYSFEEKNTQIKRSQKGSNYFEVLQQAVELGNDYALKFILGMKKVFNKEKSSFTLTYPMQSTTDTYWFKLTIRPYAGKENIFVMIHEDISSSIQAQHQLKKTENRYQIQFEQSRDGILITDANGHIIDANPAASNILGWRREELLGRHDTELMDIEDPTYKDTLKKRKETGDFKIELNLIHCNGILIPSEVTSRSFRNKKGKLRSIVTFRDISRRKQAENNLIKNKEFTESALNSNPGIFFVLDQEANLIPWNENFKSILGYSSEELYEKNALDFVVDKQKAMVKAKLEECYKTGKISVETKLITKNKDIRNFLIQANRFKQDGKTYLVGSGIDITESKEAEKEVRKNQLMLQQLFDNAPIGISIVDADNNIRQINKSFENIFSYSQQEVIGKNINELIVPDHKTEEAEHISSITRRGQSLQTESIRITKDYREIPVLIGGTPVELDDEVIAIYGMYVDISEQAKYQQKIENALHEKKTLLAELHHRVKNNLALINSLLDLQLFDSDNPQLSKELANIKNRILTIASIHEVLYKNGNLSNIPFNNFLQELVTSTDIQNESDTKNISLDNNSDNVLLDLNQSIPCGLFINELLSLIFQHTNPSHILELNICLRKYGNKIHVIVEGTDIIESPTKIREHQSLHNILIGTLVQQLNGQLLWPIPKGKYQKFELIFTKENSNSPASRLLENAD